MQKKELNHRMKKEDYKTLKTQKNDLEDFVRRLQADFDNYRKRVDQERDQIKKSANADLILSLLPVLDNFKRAADHAPTNDNWTQGVKAIEKQFEEVLSQAGLEPIKINPGEHVDTTKHEVVASEKNDQHQKDTIIREVATGYVLNGRVLRPTKVVVAS